MKDIRNDVYSRTKNSKSIDEWLQKLHPYVGENCLINGIHGEEVGKIIRNIVNTTEMTKLPPGANQEIVKGVMSEACMTYVTNVGKDIQTELQKIAVEGYNNKMAPKELANEMANKIDTLSKTRAQTIARTETMRANNLSNLIAAKENGAKSYTISCDDAACDLCLEVYGDEEDVVFDIDDTDNFPPLHPNCRCTPRFSTKPVEEEETTEELEDDSIDETNLDSNGNPILTEKELSQMSFESLAEHHGATYEGVKKYEYDGKKYHQFKQTFSNGETLTTYFEDGAVKSYAKKGIATPNEIVNEVLKVPEVLKKETNEIWFKNSQHGIHHKFASKQKYDILSNRVGGYNSCNFTHSKGRVVRGKMIDDPDHRIVINPKYFKGGGKGKTAYIWEVEPNNARGWKMTIHHEFTHSIDMNRLRWKNTKTSQDATKLCFSDEYSAIYREEQFFTWYANTQRQEAFAEHGGYISYMLSNPAEQNKLITIERIEKGKFVKEEINFQQYKKMYPKHYDYFTRLFKNKVKGVYSV